MTLVLGFSAVSVSLIVPPAMAAAPASLAARLNEMYWKGRELSSSTSVFG